MPAARKKLSDLKAEQETKTPELKMTYETAVKDTERFKTERSRLSEVHEKERSLEGVTTVNAVQKTQTEALQKDATNQPLITPQIAALNQKLADQNNVAANLLSQLFVTQGKAQENLILLIKSAQAKAGILESQIDALTQNANAQVRSTSDLKFRMNRRD